MEMLNITNCCCWWSRSVPETQLLWRNSFFLGRSCSSGLFPTKQKIFSTKLCNSGFATTIKGFASRNSVRKLRTEKGNKRLEANKNPSEEEYDGSTDSSSSSGDVGSSDDNMAAKNSMSSPSRSTVLQACTITSGLILSLGVIIRQVSHIVFMEGWPILDCSAEVSFDFEIWHLELIMGLVVLISSCRYLLLKTWPDFAESSEAANQQVLSPLQPLDYTIVAFLPGVSEELLFRGALLPLFGLNWKSALVVAAIFGVLHLGSGRRYSFAIWATFVGFAYGYATIASSSLIVPMASHVLNNLVGGLLWRYTSNSSEKI